MAELETVPEPMLEYIAEMYGSVSVWLPLDPYERKLLDDAIAIFGHVPAQKSAIDYQELFNHSEWAKSVRAALEHIILTGGFGASTTEDGKLTWDQVLSSLGGFPGKRTTFRSSLLRDANPHPFEVVKFCAKVHSLLKSIAPIMKIFSTSPSAESDETETAEIRAAGEDGQTDGSADEAELEDFESFKDWARILASRSLKPVSHDFGHWAIFARLWQIIENKKYNLPENLSPSANVGYEPEEGDWTDSARNDDILPVWSLIKQYSIASRRQNNGQKVHDYLAMAGFYDRHEYLGAGRWKSLDTDQRRSMFKFSVPYESLEFIPWTELALIEGNPESMTEDAQTALWRQRARGAFEYVFHTEEDVYRYCVTNDFYFPGFLVENTPLFIVRDWQDCDFTTDLESYMWKWHDCAITQTPAGDWKVLETIPGMQYRKLQGDARSPELLAAYRFSLMCEKHRLGTQGALKEMMGPIYNEQLEEVLSVIPFDAISASGVTYIGSGARGSIYTTTWRREPTLTRSEREIIPIAMKSFLIPNTSIAMQEHALRKELSNAAFTQQGIATGVIELYGITRTPCNLQGSILPPDTLFLVLEYAQLGTLKTYLTANLDGSASDWQLINEVVAGLAEGLNDIHKYGFVHRDIHWENLLVTRRATPNDPKDNDILAVLVSDLGEARRLSDIGISPAHDSYMNTEFRAPAPFNINTQPADLWTIGYILLRMCLWHQELEMAKTLQSTSESLVPDVFLLLMQRCLCSSPEEIPSAHDIGRLLDDNMMENLDDTTDEIHFTMVPFDIADIQPKKKSRRGRLSRRIPRGI